MGLKDQIDLKALVQAYLFSNNAEHLYFQFRDSADLRVLTKNNTIDSLVDEYERRTEKLERDVEDVVIAYAILMAITFLDCRDADETFDKVNLSCLDWGEDVKAIFGVTGRSTHMFDPRIDRTWIRPIQTEGGNSTLKINLGPVFLHNRQTISDTTWNICQHKTKEDLTKGEENDKA